MIVKANDGKKKEFHGVTFEVLAVGPQSMITKMIYKLENKVPFHTHPNEQDGYVVSGKYKICIDSTEETIQTGDSYAIPGHVQHSLEVIEPGIVIDVFTPPRQDYL
ncbi:MAG: cupin domain-containing protein [Candidatus Omnitrophota bacterium]